MSTKRRTLTMLKPRLAELPPRLKPANQTGRNADPRRTIPLQSARWQRLRASVLAEHPLCVDCSALGRVTPATDVDHDDGDPSNNARSNLVSRCHECHSTKTNRERHGLASVYGCDVNGMPLDPAHPWNKKSPATDDARPGAPLFFIANRDAMKPRQRRSDSITAAVVAAQNAAGAPIEPPGYITLPEAAAPFWRALMLNRPRDRWNDADLAIAAHLARAQADAERLQRELDAEGDLLGDKLNPRHRLLETVMKRIVYLARMLNVDAAATVGRQADQVKPLMLEQQARAIAHDDLIPLMQ